MDNLVSQLNRQDLGGHFLPQHHASQNQSATGLWTSDILHTVTCLINHVTYSTDVKGLTVKWEWPRIQIERKRSESRCRRTNRLSLVPGNIWSEQTITDSYTAEKKQYNWNTNSALRENKTTKKTAAIPKKQINNNNLNYSNNSDSLI